MRGLVSIMAALLLAALAPMQAAGAAEPRVGPALDVYILAPSDDPNDPSDDPATATLYVAGRQCLPQNAPASVLVTVDRLADQVFGATPEDNGRWSVDITIPWPVETTYVINAECDNYFGTTGYPQTEAGPDDVVYPPIPVAIHGGGGGPLPVAETGARASEEFAIGGAAVGVGLLLLWAARQRPARVKITARPTVSRGER